MNSQSDEPPKPARRFPWRRAIFSVAALLVVFWLIHPPLLRRTLRVALTQAAESAGYGLEIGTISARFGRPVVFEQVRLHSPDAEASRSAVVVSRIEVALNWPWRAFLGPRRIFHAVRADGIRGVIDLDAVPAAAADPDPADETPRDDGRGLLQFLPESADIRGAELEVRSASQLYYLQGLTASFSEEHLGAFHLSGAEIAVGSLRENFGELKGVTAWKDGTVYLADLQLRDGLRVENFDLQLTRPGGIGLGLEAAVFGGSLRADVSFGTEKGRTTVDAAVWAAKIDMAPLSAFLGLRGKADGILREARLTFRGVPEAALDGQASLRLAADGFRWNERGWESLEIGASLIHRRLGVSEFSLRQKDNTLSGNGEVSFSGGWQGLAKAPFLLNASASIRDLSALAGLFGSPFDEMAGRMTLSSSISGQDGKLNGYLSLEGSDMDFRMHPVESGRIEVAFANSEAQVSQCEFWSGEDFVRAKGTVEIAAPHHYTGDLQARLQDVALYLDLLQARDVPAIYAGAAQVRWQGDGNAAAHSGAFHLALEDFVSEHTPSGLTGRFAGTYSPQNLYFSGFELEHKGLRFSTRATLASSGVKLSDAVLRAGGREIADAEVFLPVDPFLFAAGKPVAEALREGKSFYASVKSRGPLNLRDLLRLAGNDFPVDGTVEMALRASGPAEDLAVTGKIAGRGLAVKFDDGSGPVSQFDAAVSAAGGKASLSGTLAPRGLPAITLSAETPFGFLKSADGSLHWMNPEGKISGRLDVPRTELAIFRPFLPKLHRIKGTLAGGVSVTGTVAQPQFDGSLALSGGRLEFSPRGPVIGNINGSVRFDAARAAIEKLTGDVSAGPFELRGGVSLANPADPQYELAFQGDKILLARDARLRLRANVDLTARGGKSGGSVAGSVKFVDGRIYQRLEITPLIVPSPVEAAAFVPPRVDGLVPPPFGAWTVDVSVTNDTPFTLGGNIASGEIIPDLRLTGTLGRPVPVGRVELRNARAFLPFTTLDIREGRLDFIADSPWMPQIDVRGEAQALDYEVQAYAFGPLNERRLILRSDPPLPQESIILLLTTGFAPGVYAGAGFGEAAAGQGGLLLLRAFARQLQPHGVDVDSLLNRLQVSSVPPQYQGGRATLRGRFDLWRGLALMSERDSFGFYNAGATYSFRFR